MARMRTLALALLAATAAASPVRPAAAGEWRG